MYFLCSSTFFLPFFDESGSSFSTSLREKYTYIKPNYCEYYAILFVDPNNHYQILVTFFAQINILHGIISDKGI